MNKQNVKRVVCVQWKGTRFSANKIYIVHPVDGTVMSKTGQGDSAFAWHEYNEPLFRPAYKNDIEVADATYYRKYKILP